MAAAGVAPRIMGIGPAPATPQVLARAWADTRADRRDRAQRSLRLRRRWPSLRDLGLPDDAPHVNPNGGAIALGHPLGMSGARLALTAVNALETLGVKRAVATMCIGVGQGIAALISAFKEKSVGR